MVCLNPARTSGGSSLTFPNPTCDASTKAKATSRGVRWRPILTCGNSAQVYRDGNPDEPLLVWLYFANRQPNPPLPNAAYKKQLVDGAKFWRLPQEYQAQLARIQTA